MAKRSFLGKGPSFPLRVNGRGAISQSEEELLVQEAILQVLLTSFGERVMRRDFGSRLNELPFEPNDTFLQAQVFNSVTQALQRWERRIEILDVTALQNPNVPQQLDIFMSYRLIRENKIGNLVFPFFLTGESSVLGSNG